MLKIRVIPTLLWKNFGLVKGVSFDSWRRVGPILPAIKVYNQREVDELILVDILATELGEEIDLESISDFCQESFVPFTYGGGIRSLEQVQAVLRVGADKVAINSAAFSNLDLISQVAKKHGAQCVVASVDVKQNTENNWQCFSVSGKNDTKIDAIEWCKQLEDMGAGEILLTSIDRDGTMSGYDLALVEAVASKVNIPVIASGGAGSYEDIVKVVVQAGASAVAAASIFHFTEQTPAGVKLALKDAGVPIREIYSEKDL